MTSVKGLLALFVLKFVLLLAGIRVNSRNPRPGNIVVHNPLFIFDVIAGGNDFELSEAYVRKDWECADLPEFYKKLIKLDLKLGLGRWIPNTAERKLKEKGAVCDLQDERHSEEAAEHYNLPAKMYELILGPPPYIYTSAYPTADDEDLGTAQRRKVDRMARKLDLQPHHKVLDIGCGWGGILDYLARRYGVKGVGISTSRGHIEYALEHYARDGLQYLLMNYQKLPVPRELFDRIVSFEMIEAVGLAHLPEYFGKAASVLKSGGLFGLQAILTIDPYHAVNEFIEKYIFPGGELATREQVLKAANDKGFTLVEEEYFPDKYVWTLAQWRKNLWLNKDEFIRLYGETWFRIFDCYLSKCEAGFATGRTTVGQLVFQKN